MSYSSLLRGLFAVIRNHNKLTTEGIPQIGRGSSVNAKNAKIIIGRGFLTFSNVHLAAFDNALLEIGEHVFLNRNCIVIARGTTKIGKDTRFGPNVCVYDHNHVFDDSGVYNDLKAGEIVIGERCWIGAGAIILKDTHIGDGCVIGAGCVVKGDIPPHSIVTAGRDLSITPIRKK